MTAPDGETVALTADGALVLHGPDAARALCDGWIPVGRQPATLDGARAVISVELARTDASPAAPTGPSTFTLGPVTVLVRGDSVTLAGAARGEVSLGDRRAVVAMPGGADEHAALARRSALTAAAALLLGRLDRALAHAGAVVHPSTGEAWLLVGDTHSGKSTTVANLARAGWGVLADDTVSLSASGRAVLVEGWPRAMHLDAGWGSATPEGTRVARDPREVIDGGPAAGTRPLGGLLFPHVDAGRPTAASPRSGADALALLLRQSPWLFADAAAAPSVLALLRRAASAPAADLSLGADSFADPGRLDAVVRGATG